MSTDNRNELFDLVDGSDRVLGTVKRGDTNTNPALIHRAVAIMVFDERGRLFLQKRSRSKDTYPGYWSISASGHVKSGETYPQAAIRELQEELGIKRPPKFKRLHKVLIRYPDETEFEVFFKVTINGPLKLDKEEIEEGRWFTLNRRFFRNTLEKIKITPELKVIVENFLTKAAGS
jgi:isopentenyl-diphosphate delta-isomerase type 1